MGGRQFGKALILGLLQWLKSGGDHFCSIWGCSGTTPSSAADCLGDSAELGIEPEKLLHAKFICICLGSEYSEPGTISFFGHTQ